MGDNDNKDGVVESGVPIPAGGSFFEQYIKQEQVKEHHRKSFDVTYEPNSLDEHLRPPSPDMINPNSPFAKKHVSQDDLDNQRIGNKDLDKFVQQQTPSEKGEQQEFAEKESITEDDFKTNKIEDLVLLGRVEREVDFYGNKIVLQTLTGIHNIDIVDETAHFKAGTRLAASIIGTLVRSVKSINGRKLYAEDQSELSSV